MKSSKHLSKVIFLDVDGVMNNYKSTPGSYMTHRADGYGVSRENFERLVKLASKTGARVVISSNWRRFSEDPASPFYYWNNMVSGPIPNPLPKLKEMLKSVWYGDLPKDRHINKSEALELWFEDENIDHHSLKYVIFDDDDREGYASSKFSSHFIKTDSKVGLTDADCTKAEVLLA